MRQYFGIFSFLISLYIIFFYKINMVITLVLFATAIILNYNATPGFFKKISTIILIILSVIYILLIIVIIILGFSISKNPYPN